MAARNKISATTDATNRVEEFHVYSWTEQEYMDAIRQEDFWNNVDKYLDADVAGAEPRLEDRLLAKLYYAGTSARWMFHCSTSQVISQIDTSVRCANDIIPYSKNTIGDQSNSIVNRLLSLSETRPGALYDNISIVSGFAAYRLAMKAGAKLVRTLAEVADATTSPVFHGWLFELWFFAQLAKEGITLLLKTGRKTDFWPASSVFVLDVADFPAWPENRGCWYRPQKWNQGGFDAVFIDRAEGLVRFVQVTSCLKHSLKLKCFRDFLDDLTVHVSVSEVHIIFLVEQTKHQDFQIGTVSGQGLLRKSFGWKTGEEKERVRVFGMRGWQQE